MKIFFLLFVAYLVALPLVPCGDLEKCNTTKNEIISKADSDCGDEHEDECSPSCYCNCCNSIAALTEYDAYHFDAGIRIWKLRFSGDNSSFQLNSIWQPPRNV